MMLDELYFHWSNIGKLKYDSVNPLLLSQIGLENTGKSYKGMEDPSKRSFLLKRQMLLARNL